MVADQPDREIMRQLLRTPPSEFVAERNRVVKELRARGGRGGSGAGDGARELAAALAGLRRLGLTDWALNVAAGEHPEEVGEFAEAANEVIDAQEAAMEGRDAGDLRLRLKLLRMCTSAVATLANDIATKAGLRGAGSSVSDMTTRLSGIAANKSAVALLQAGLLGSEDPGVVDPFAADDAVAETPRRRDDRARPARSKRPDNERPEPPTIEDNQEVLRARRQALTAAEKALSAASAAAGKAEQAVRKQEAATVKAESHVADLEASLDAARAALAEESAALENLREQHDRARAEVDAKQSSVDEARELVDAAS